MAIQKVLILLLLIFKVIKNADCISRFPWPYGTLSSGIQPLLVITNGVNNNFYFLEEAGSLQVLHTLEYGYFYFAAKITPWSSATQFNAVADFSYLVFGGVNLHILFRETTSLYSFKIDFFYSGVQTFQVAPIRLTNTQLITALAIDPTTQDAYIAKIQFTKATGTTSITQISKLTGLIETSYYFIFSRAPDNSYVIWNQPILVSSATSGLTQIKINLSTLINSWSR